MYEILDVSFDAVAAFAARLRGKIRHRLTRKNMEILATEVFPYVRKYAELEFASLPGVRARQQHDLHA
jgi:hypothetical protein